MNYLSNFRLNVIEFGVSFVILVVAVALLAISEEISGQWSNLACLAIIVAFTIAMSLLGWKIAPYMYDHFG